MKNNYTSTLRLNAFYKTYVEGPSSKDLKTFRRHLMAQHFPFLLGEQEAKHAWIYVHFDPEQVRDQLKNHYQRGSDEKCSTQNRCSGGHNLESSCTATLPIKDFYEEYVEQPTSKLISTFRRHVIAGHFPFLQKEQEAKYAHLYVRFDPDLVAKQIVDHYNGFQWKK